MAVNPRRIAFASFQEMAAHLDRWAADHLAGPDAWADAVLASRDWLDYSSRNQVLLASYGVDGPVAGVETWRLLPSSTEGRECAVRAGEHGYPVRVPITVGGIEPDPFLGGHRPTKSTVERWEWRPVFSLGQLARHPKPDSLTPTSPPTALSGDGAGDAYLKAVRQVATATVRGRLPKGTDPHRVVADAAGRLRRSTKRPTLDSELRAQVAFLVADRVDAAAGTLPGFDPSHLPPRERWERLQDVLDPARKLTAALGVACGVDLCASPLPRMEIEDDRVVPAGQRRRLPAASFDKLSVGEWVEVGPYTAAEWAARGEQATGRGAYFRLNKSAYLVAIERGDSAGWRLEDIAARTGHGQLAQGEAATLADARADAETIVRARYPALAPQPEHVAVTPGATRAGAWQTMPGEGRISAQVRRLSDDVTVYALPGPGGRWLPALQSRPGGELEQLPLVRTSDLARDAAELAGRRAVRLASVASPVQYDAVLASLANSDDYSRRELGAIVGTRLLTADHRRLADAAPAELAELLGQAGTTPATIVAVLDAEHVPTADAAALLPTIGVPIPDGIRVLTERWNVPRREAAELLEATASEMRAAGCTPVEILASRPRDVLRSLPAEPHLWELAAGTMATAGHPPSVVASHLAAHAPTPDTYASGLATLAPDPMVGLALATRHATPPEHLAAATERYGLSPSEVAALLADLAVSPSVVVETLWERCDHDPDITTALAVSDGRLDPNQVTAAMLAAGITEDLATTPTPIRGSGPGREPDDAAALLATLPPVGPSVDASNDAGIVLPDPIQPIAQPLEMVHR